MCEAIEYLKKANILDKRQETKVKYPMNEIIGIAFFATLGNADNFGEIEAFGKEHEEGLREYFRLEHGIPSHDTTERAFAMFSPKFLEHFQSRFNEMLNNEEGEIIKKIIGIDGKTQRGNDTEEQKANHIVSAVDNDGFCLGQVKTADKSNEITAMPELIENLNVAGHIVTTDAMGCQTEIAKKIRKKKADYVLALKGNQGTLFDDVKLYFGDKEILSKCAYHRTIEKARSGLEEREYWQTEDIEWLPQAKEWSGIKSIAMTRNTITKNGNTATETRYFISSLPVDVKEIARAIRGHWMVESYHWHLDVTFREDENRTIDKQAAYNLNVLKKLAINTLKLLDVGKKVSMKLKRYMISLNPVKYLAKIMEI
jgi:predicted transposase YbfD/YdcC